MASSGTIACGPRAQGQATRSTTAHAALVFHIEPRRPRAEDIISAARPTKVPSCCPSSEERGVRAFRGIEMGLVAAGVDICPSACEVDVSVVGLGRGSGFTGGVTTGLACASGLTGATFVCSAMTGEFAGVGKNDLRCSSSSGIGDGMSNGTLWPACTATRRGGTAVWTTSCPCAGRAVVALAVDEPDTDEGGDSSRFTSGISIATTDDSLPSLVGEFTTPGGLTLAASALPLLSRPRSLSSLPILRPRSRPFADAPLAATPRASAEPVGDRLPIGELVPWLPERSLSESEALRVSERPRDSERESVERE